MGAGFLGHGTLTVQDGLTLRSDYGYIGYQAGSDGEVTISGTNSAWEIATPDSIASNLYVGYRGNGQLNLLDGGAVSVQDETHIGRLEGASGSIHFDNGTLTTSAFFGGANQMTGTGTINTNGIIADGVDLVFDNTNGLQQTFTIGGPGRNITVNLDQSDMEVFGAGYTGTGSLTIRDGLHVVSNDYNGSYLGYWAGATGTATVSGTGSTWDVYRLIVGRQGEGHLHVVDGGTVNGEIYVGYEAGSTGTVTVSGSGSVWNSEEARIGYAGNGTLNITDGGMVFEEERITIGSQEGVTGMVNVSGIGSVLEIMPGSFYRKNSLYVGGYGEGIVNITYGGLVKTQGLYIDYEETGDSFVNLSNGGRLALKGEAYTSLEAFLELVDGSDAICWWDDSIGGWASLETATMGTDYWLDYFIDGDLEGYTVLTVGVVPEPGSVALVLSALLAMGFVSISRNHVARYSSRR